MPKTFNDMTAALQSRFYVFRPWALKIDALLISFLKQILGPQVQGRITLTLPSGTSATLGSASAPIGANLVINNYRIVTQSLRRGLLGFAECYMQGDIDCDNLKALFDFYFENEKQINAIGPGAFKTGFWDRVAHRMRANTRRGSRRNISAHYDLGTNFYKLWLDETLLYSSAIYSKDDEALEDAQRTKVERILRSLQLTSQHDVLEIGCGWGCLTVAAGQVSKSMVAVTISRDQLMETKSRIMTSGVSGRVTARFEDYRDIRETFDRIVSVEMIEAVGEENWPTYFGVLRDRLRPGGFGVLQAITLREDLFDSYRRTPDFIQRYVFPGGMLPTVDSMRLHAVGAGLSFEVIETFGKSYARTLNAWRERFLDAWPRIAALGFDERFKRMWIYYLTYCEVGFERGTIDVGLYKVAKPSDAPTC